MNSIFLQSRTLPTTIQLQQDFLEFRNKWSFIYKDEMGWQIVVQNNSLEFGLKTATPIKTQEKAVDKVKAISLYPYFKSLSMTHESILSFNYLGRLMYFSTNLESVFKPLKMDNLLKLAMRLWGTNISLNTSLNLIFGDGFCEEKEYYIECLRIAGEKDSRLIIEEIIAGDKNFAVIQLVKN